MRTYSLDQRGGRGVVFLSMEANRLAWVLAGRATGLPYAWARQRLVRHVHELRYHSARRWPGLQSLSSHVGIRVGQAIEGGPLDQFLTARWRLHHRVSGATLAVRFTHDPWPLRTADVVDLYDDLFPATGLPAPRHRRPACWTRPASPAG